MRFVSGSRINCLNLFCVGVDLGRSRVKDKNNVCDCVRNFEGYAKRKTRSCLKLWRLAILGVLILWSVCFLRFESNQFGSVRSVMP